MHADYSDILVRTTRQCLLSPGPKPDKLLKGRDSFEGGVCFTGAGVYGKCIKAMKHFLFLRAENFSRGVAPEKARDCYWRIWRTVHKVSNFSNLF